MSAGKRGRPSIPVGARGRILPKRKGAQWHCRVRYRDLGGARHEFNAVGKTRQECEDNAASRWVEIKSEFELAAGRAATSMRFVVERWLESLEVLVTKQKLAPGTVRQYRTCWNGTLGPLLDDLDVNELTRAQIQTLLRDGLFRRNQRGDYALDELGQRIPLKGTQPRQVLGSALNFAADFGYRRDGMSPLYGTTRPPREEVGERHRRVLTDEDWLRLLEMARVATTRARVSPHLYCTLLIIHFTGIRIGEALGLTISKVDIVSDPPTLTVDTKLPESYRVGDHDPLEPTKSKDTRVIVAVPELHALLVELLTHRSEAALDEPLIMTRRGTFVTHANVRRALRELVKGTDLEWVHPHALRRTYLTAADKLFGTDAAAELAGHDDSETTEKHYIVRDGVRLLDPRLMFQRPSGEGDSNDEGERAVS